MDGLELREVRVYGPGLHKLDPAELPWLAGLRFCMIAGDGGASPDGPGGHGQQIVTALSPPDGVETLEVGRGKKGFGGFRDGQDGAIIVELWG